MASVTLTITANDRASSAIKDIVGEIKGVTRAVNESSRAFASWSKDINRATSQANRGLNSVRGGTKAVHTDIGRAANSFRGLGDSGYRSGNQIKDAMGNAGGSVRGVRGAADEGRGQFEGLGIAGVAAGSLIAEMFQTAIVGAIQAATAAMGLFVSAIKEASNIELGNLTSAGGLAAMSGTGFDEALKLTESQRVRIAKEVGNLAGSTASYTSLAGSISDDAAKATTVNGKFDEKAFGDLQAETAKNFGLMEAVNPDVTADGMRLFLTRAMSGSSTMKQLGNLDAVEKNAGFKSALEKEMAGREMADLSQLERFEVLNKAAVGSGIEEIAQRAGETMAGQWEGMMTKLSDPDVGLFGFMRDLDPSEEGRETVTEGLSSLTKALFGDDGLFGAISQLLGGSGISDPMRQLKDTLDWLTKQVNGATKWVRGWKPKEDIEGFLDAAMANLAGWVHSLNWGAVGVALGKAVSGLAKGLVFAIWSVNWVALLGGAIAGADWWFLFKAVLGGAVAVALAGIVGWWAVPLALLFTSLVRMLGDGITDGVGGFFSGLGKMWTSLTKSSAKLFGSLNRLVDGFFKGFFDGASNLNKAASSGWNNAMSKLRDFWSFLTGLFQKAKDFVSNAIPDFSVPAPLAAAGAAIADPVQAVKDVGSTVLSTAQQIPIIGDVFKGGIFESGKAQGYIPDTGLGNFLQTAINESQISGATPLIANDSEAILNRPQQAALASALSTSSSNNTINSAVSSPHQTIHANFSPNITVTANASPQQAATDIIAELGREWSLFKSSQLSRRSMVT